MTLFLDVAATCGLINQMGVENALSGLAEFIAEDYRRWAVFEKSARVASHSAVGVIELMPTCDGQLYGFKYVNGHPANTAKGVPCVMAFGALADVETGMPLLLAEMTVTTAMRTAATSAVAARAMARSGSKRMAVIGCGAQSEFQILAFKAVLGIDEVRVYDIDPAAVAKLRRNLADIAGLRLIDAPSAREAVAGADIVTTLTAAKGRAVVLTPDMIEPGMHLNAVGGDCPGKTELAADIVRTARVAVEFTPQTRIEGEIQQMPADFPVLELWEILTGKVPGRENAAQVTLFDSVGFALEDFSTLRFLKHHAECGGAGTSIDLVPDLRDPRDLFGALKTAV